MLEHFGVGAGNLDIFWELPALGTIMLFAFFLEYNIKPFCLMLQAFVTCMLIFNCPIMFKNEIKSLPHTLSCHFFSPTCLISFDLEFPNNLKGESADYKPLKIWHLQVTLEPEFSSLSPQCQQSQAVGSLFCSPGQVGPCTQIPHSGSFHSSPLDRIPPSTFSKDCFEMSPRTILK